MPPRSGLVWRICQRQSNSGARAPVDCRRQRRGPAAVQRRKTHALAVNGDLQPPALREEYDRYQFQTGSDCEVIRAVSGKRPEFLDDLQGMFAFALYDSEKDAYLIGRDHIGIIPLYGP